MIYFTTHLEDVSKEFAEEWRLNKSGLVDLSSN